MAFEQLLGNALAQLAHTSDLFSLDATVARTYFVKPFDAGMIKDLADIADPLKLTRAAVEALVETPAEFQTRRNAFLDHLLARFGEQFSEYALLLTQAAGDAVAKSRLIDNKIAFLRRYPAVSHDRAKAFNYQLQPNAPGNEPGIKQRINLLLGYPDLAYGWSAGAPAAGVYPVDYQLVDGIGTVRLFLDNAKSIESRLPERAPRPVSATLVTAELPSGVVHRLANRLNGIDGVDLNVCVVKNEFFGGGINIAGLLTAQNTRPDA